MSLPGLMQPYTNLALALWKPQDARLKSFSAQHRGVQNQNFDTTELHRLTFFPCHRILSYMSQRKRQRKNRKKGVEATKNEASKTTQKKEASKDVTPEKGGGSKLIFYHLLPIVLSNDTKKKAPSHSLKIWNCIVTIYIPFYSTSFHYTNYCNKFV